jgi:tetratricopeptide repeat protein 21B
LTQSQKLAGGGAMAVDALFGKAYFLCTQKNTDDALQTYNVVLGLFPDYMPALVEKAKMHLAMGDWEDAVETCHRCHERDPNCIAAHRILVLHSLCRVGNSQEAAKALGQLIQAIDATEPRNHALFYSASLGPTRMSGRQPLVLQQTRELLNRAMELSPGNPMYLNERGFQQIMSGKVRDAAGAYRDAMKLDETSVVSLNGVIHCQLLSDQVDEAAQQIEFLNEIQASIGKTAELSYLSALLASKRKLQSTVIFDILGKPVKEHILALKSSLINEDMFVKLSPDLMLRIVSLYLEYGPSEPPSEGDAAAPVLAECAVILEALTKAAPGLLEGVFMLARVKFLSGDTDAAKSGARYCLGQDNAHVDAHLLMARINISQGNFRQADTDLSTARDYNFEVREYPMYYLIQSKIQQAEGDYEASIKTLSKAYKLPGVQKMVAPGANVKRAVAQSDRVSVYLELAGAFFKTDHQHEAAKIMQDAMMEFQGTSEEMRVQIANADLAVGRGDIDAAITLLREITPEQSYFVQAKEKMAKIYLEHRKDKKLYAACYKELVDLNPTGHTCLLLGDAYMSIHEPKKAIGVYESAFKKNPRDAVLASKIGQALVKTHDYTQAIRYYEGALKSDVPQIQLRADLAELYLKLREYDKCERKLQEALTHEPTSDLETMQNDVKYRLLMAKMHSEANRPVQAMQVLEEAKATQIDVLQRVATERPEAHRQQLELASEICSQIAQYHQDNGDNQRSVKVYQEALQHDPDSINATLSLAKLYLIMSEDHKSYLESAESQLMILWNKDQKNDEATMMLADVAFRKQDNEQAISYFQQLLNRKPEHYEALSSLIDLLRRAGKLTDCTQYLDEATKMSPRPDTEPGLNFCRGIYHRLLGGPKTNDALKFFSLASKDNEFGVRALYNMVEIFLNPEDATLGGEAFEASTRDAMDVQKCLDSAESALQELARAEEHTKKKFKVLSFYASMASKSKSKIDVALKGFGEILEADMHHVPSLLGMAHAYMLLGAKPKARSQLKLIQRERWNADYADEFERAWLLLADIYIQNGKHDMADEPLKQCLVRNKSCSKAWEYKGHIWEKDQAYVNAAECYEYAWEFSSQKQLNIGFKLAFNYLKAKRYADSIDICHKVLEENPAFPKIKKDIMVKARELLRV